MTVLVLSGLAAPAAQAAVCDFSIAAGKNQSAVSYQMPASVVATCDPSNTGIFEGNNPITTAHGGVANAQGPSFAVDGVQYTPPSGYSGLDTFPIQGDDVSRTGTVSVSVLALAPNVTSVPVSVALSGEALVVSGGSGTYSSFSLAGGALPAGVTLNSDGTLTGTPTASGVFNFTVTFTDTGDATSGPQSVTTTASLTVQASAPSVSGVSPTSGPAAGGTSVTITGASFTGATAVDFGSTAASSFTVNSSTSITAVAPAGSGVVDVTVTGPAGVSVTSS
ncbi:MAG: IPT/TIG domain-containing protein, partial [Caulobacteraceae bacterium]|nr:IPT/TIG domain-containing protein [Caulobacteraceae bacterium]